MKISCLAALPLAIVPFFAAAGDVAVSEDFENGVGAWKFSSPRFAVKQGMGVDGSAALVWTGAESNDKWEFATLSFKGKVGHEYSLAIKGRPTKDVVGRLYVRLVSKRPDGKRTFFRLDGRPIINNSWRTKSMTGWTDLSGCCPPIPPGGEDCMFEIAVLPRTTGSVSFDSLRVVEGEKVVIKWTESSVYRNVAKDGKVKFAAYYTLDPKECPLDSRRVGFRLRDADGKDVFLAADVASDTFFTAETSVERLAMGEQCVRACIEDARDGRTIDCAKLAFTRVAEMPRRKVYFDSYHRLIVDGKPFFPLGCYGGGRNEHDSDVYASAGFNCAVIRTAEQVDRLSRRNIKSIIDCCGNKTSVVERAVHSFATNENVIAWYTADELPIGFQRSEVKLHRHMHELDRERPTLMVLDQPFQTRDHLASFDLIGTDPYPVCNNPGKKVSDASRYPEIVREMTFGMRPIWQVPQAFDWHWHRRNFHFAMKEHRFPNREEFVSMSWQPIACGVLGLLWYDFDWFMKDIPKEEFEATWGYFKDTVSKMAAHADVFLSVEPTEQPKIDNPAIRARAWKKGDRRYVLVCNVDDKPVSVRLGLDIPGEMAAVEGDVPKRDGNNLVYNLAPYAVSFVRFGR